MNEKPDNQPPKQETEAKFLLGQLLITPEAMNTLAPEEALAALARHASGDWGDCSAEDKAENDFALGKYLRLLNEAFDNCTRLARRLCPEPHRGITSAVRRTSPIRLPQPAQRRVCPGRPLSKEMCHDMTLTMG